MRKLLLLITCVLLIWANRTIAQDKQRELDSIMTHWQGLAKFNGTVLVAQHGKTILHKGYGIIAVDNGNRLDEKTLYITGGCTEMFTATVIFKLQEEGKLNIEDKLSKYLTGFHFADKVSIKHLLAHQSGIYDYMNNDTLYNNGVGSPRERKDILGYFKNQPLAFEPGKSFKYSTSNYYLLGMIIEQVADTDYYATVRKYILDPLGIENSGFNFSGFASWEKAQGYAILNQQRMIPAFPIDSTVSFAAASLFTNSAGMYKWANAFLGNKILKKASWQTMTTERMNNYTYGWETKDILGKKAIGHTGETYGYLSAFYVIPADSTIILLLSNDTESEIFFIIDNIASALNNLPYTLPKPRSAVFLEQRRLEQYEGRYEFEGGMDLNIFSKDKLLWGKVSGQTEFTLLADVIPDEFFMSSADVEFRFIRDKKTNQVTDVIIRQNRKEQKGHKWQ